MTAPNEASEQGGSAKGRLVPASLQRSFIACDIFELLWCMVDSHNLLICVAAIPLMRQDADRCIRSSEALCALRYLLAEDGLSACVCVCVCVCRGCSKSLRHVASAAISLPIVYRSIPILLLHVLASVPWPMALQEGSAQSSAIGETGVACSRSRACPCMSLPC